MPGGMASISDRLKKQCMLDLLVVVHDFYYHWLFLLISGTIEFSPLILTFSFLFNFPFGEFDQIMTLGPKVVPSWGSYVLHRLI